MSHLWPPVVGICGWKDAGKTTLIEALIPRLIQRGLHVGVVKHDAHGLRIDEPGKDTDRYFQAGADVVAHDDVQMFARRRITSRGASLRQLAWHVGGRYELVLVEGHKDSPIPKIWLTGEGDAPPPEGLTDVIGTIQRGDGLVDKAFDLIIKAAEDFQRRVQTVAGVLVGGASTRMGRPKALLPYRHHTLVEHVLDVVRPWVSSAVLLGAGPLPPGLCTTPQIADAADTAGPIAGILSAMRWAPRVRWLILPCDLPLVTNEAIEWLLHQPRLGRAVTMPKLPGTGMPEPLFAVYDPPARKFLEDAVETNQLSLRRAFPDDEINVCRVPEEHADAWHNVNTPDEWHHLRDRV